jgi:MoaA/NifB/PqqE/SkfB family radical SAM enzyme
MLKTVILSPLQTLRAIGHRVLLNFRHSPQVARLREIARANPLILQIETTNICNSRCVFCAYPSMKRRKGIMSMALFEKVVQDYCRMGGGPVSLTPVVGDALLDPHLLERIEILAAQPEINQISLTTNAIALERYSDDDLRKLLKSLDCMQVSVGGLDPLTYRTLYGVDQFPQVQQAMERLLDLKDSVPGQTDITFAFRTTDWQFERRFRRQLKEYRRRGAFISHIWNYANYAGMVQTDKQLQLEVIDGHGEKLQPCIYATVHMAVCWDGQITACGCADFEGQALKVGHAGEETLAEVWSGKKRAAILASFASGKAPGICRKCSAYQPDLVIFSQPFCKGILSRHPLPREYFQQFWGG